MIKTTDDFPIKKEYFYIVDFRNYHRLKIYSSFFVDKKSANKAIEMGIKNSWDRKKFFMVVKGTELLGIKYPYYFGKKFRYAKYPYKKNQITSQQRKSYRTRLRRRLRRMGLLTLVQPKKRVGEPIKQTRLIKNRQKVANSPSTEARVFQLQRKNPKYYYFILSKSKSKRKGILSEVNCLRVDVKNEEIKKTIIRIKSKDIIIPFLVTELLNLLENEKIKKRILKKFHLTLAKTKEVEDEVIQSNLG